MGTAKIIGGGPAGRYDIELVKHTALAEKRIAGIDARLPELAGEIDALSDREAEGQIEVSGKLAALHAAIQAFNNGLGTAEAVDLAEKEYLDSQGGLHAVQRELSMTRLEELSLLREKDRLQKGIQPEELPGVWCADLSEELSGEVGTGEINGESETIFIMPGGKEGLGKLQPVLSSTPAAAAYNFAMLPGWQKWRPTYRTGTITAVDYDKDTLDVALAPTASKARGMGINQEENLYGVPAAYMTCNAQAFQVGDHVVVEFGGQDWAAARVIGFVEHPKACPLFVEIKTQSITANPDFITLANQRLADMQREMTLIEQCRNEFIPEYLAYLDSLVGLPYAWVFGFLPIRYTQEQVDAWKQPYIEWRDVYYFEWVEKLNESMDNWQDAKTALQYLPSYGRGDYVMGNPEHDVTGAVLGDLTLNVSCEEIPPADLTPDDPERATPFQIAAEKSEVGEDLWESISSPVADGRVYVPGFVEFVWQGRGAIDTAGVFYYLSRNYGYNFVNMPERNGQIETLTISIAIDGKNIFEFPSAVSHNVHTWKLEGVNNPKPSQVSARVSGRLASVPEKFGATVKPVDYDPGTGRVKDWGGIEYDEDPFTWYNWWARVLFHDPPHVRFPTAFCVFAGRYPDHPIVTGKDVTRPVDMSPEAKTALMAEVNAYVNGTFGYVPDEERNDHWTFLSPSSPSGDCDDFAITKIQMLLDRGFSISELKLEVGARAESYNPPLYSNGVEVMNYIGHAWVTVGDICLDLSGVVSRATMHERYPHFLVIQKAGLSWASVEDGREITAYPWPHGEFDISLYTCEATLTRK